ncbi:uncharacterized protein LAESUDRAFT_653110 [Laetiporus sulphureus 93-53]|uniref:Uncharacterized protein n=1 Tax=Laetiporus sulphureus 93-53 TaxID=1314785 RepID=A0A165EB71_9APHY|nr:uncharacterized protein LAESUDRAFT_653110 [Laetiporus sulphureus 93-53]KZT06642.1 hypothetical protein LAESUDRAFT_653110 [Laetiporus sulphureus 93-53]
MSCTEWKREPTILDVFFGFLLPYRPPRSALGAFVWRRRMWLETTFALSMMEPWEKVLVACFFWTLFALLTAGIYLYLPDHISYVYGRTKYYLLGRELGVTSALSWSSRWAAAGNVTPPLGYVLDVRDAL